MEIILQSLGYAIIAGTVTGIFYLFYKILSQGFKAFTKNDD